MNIIVDVYALQTKSQGVFRQKVKQIFTLCHLHEFDKHCIYSLQTTDFTDISCKLASNRHTSCVWNHILTYCLLHNQCVCAAYSGCFHTLFVCMLYLWKLMHNNLYITHTFVYIPCNQEDCNHVANAQSRVKTEVVSRPKVCIGRQSG